MTIAFVLGNGVSRRGVPLYDLQAFGPVYGCNALYRDFEPAVLVATDRPIATQIQESGYSARKVFYTRKPLPGLGALTVPKPYYGFSSGPIATALAALDQHRKIYMIGFDMGPAENNKFNNLYAGSEFYRTPDSIPTYTGNWIKQIQTIARDFPSTQFIRVQGKTTARLAELDGIGNLQHLPLDAFLERINTQKDL